MVECFILNLRQVKPLAESSEVSDNQSTSVRFVGNAGESLQLGVESEFDEEYTVHVEERDIPGLEKIDDRMQ